MIIAFRLLKYFIRQPPNSGTASAQSPPIQSLELREGGVKDCKDIVECNVLAFVNANNLLFLFLKKQSKFGRRTYVRRHYKFSLRLTNFENLLKNCK